MPVSKCVLIASIAACLVAGTAAAQKKYDPGASDTEIRIGNIMPYSGPASAYGDDLTRENMMRQAASLKNVDLGMLLPGITANTAPTDYFPLEELQMRRFNGEGWENFGPIISGEIGS